MYEEQIEMGDRSGISESMPLHHAEIKKRLKDVTFKQRSVREKDNLQPTSHNLCEFLILFF